MRTMKETTLYLARLLSLLGNEPHPKRIQSPSGAKRSIKKKQSCGSWRYPKHDKKRKSKKRAENKARAVNQKRLR